MKSNRESNWRYKLFWVDFCGDGMFSKPRVKGKDKRFLRKKSKREVLKDLYKSEDISQYLG